MNYHHEAKIQQNKFCLLNTPNYLDYRTFFFFLSHITLNILFILSFSFIVLYLVNKIIFHFVKRQLTTCMSISIAWIISLVCLYEPTFALFLDKIDRFFLFFWRWWYRKKDLFNEVLNVFPFTFFYLFSSFRLSNDS